MSKATTVLVAFAIALVATTTGAHEVNFSRGDYRPSPGGAEAWMTLARPDLLNALPALDADGDGKLSDAEIVASEAIDARILSLVTATRGTTPCTGTVTEVSPTEKDGGMFVVRFGPCEGNSDELTIHIGGLLQSVATGHRHTAFIHTPGQERPRDMILHGEKASVAVPMGEGAPTAVRSAPQSSEATTWSIGSHSFGLGFSRLWKGLDHALFLLGLVLLCARRKDLITAALAFAVAHSLTLALAMFGVLAPRASMVAPMLALTVVYVGVDNLFTRNLERRWPIAIPFGFVHGFALASAAQLPKDRLRFALGSFNAGVEVGLALFVLAVGLLLAVLRKQPWFKARGASFVSAAVALLGLVWFAQRLI